MLHILTIAVRDITVKSQCSAGLPFRKEVDSILC